jgi:hypothetical protein
MLLLPTGQVLAVDGTLDVEIYTPDPVEEDHHPQWAPVITSVPKLLQPGRTYDLEGIRLNGMSQGSAFGDEEQNATNYPLVRITNLATKHVSYARTHDHSSMAVASDRISSTHFDVPTQLDSGLSSLEVVANGVASRPEIVFVK